MQVCIVHSQICLNFYPKWYTQNVPNSRGGPSVSDTLCLWRMALMGRPKKVAGEASMIS